MRRWLLLIGMVAVGLGLSACGGRIIRAPLSPYVAGDLRTRQVRRVAVLPTVVPDYLRGQGGENVSVDLTNKFMSELARRRLFDLVGGAVVTDAMRATGGDLGRWLYEGNVAGAVKLGRELKVDAVVFGRVVRFVQANLARSEFEVQFELIEISSMETVWSVRELLVGEGGTAMKGEAVTSPTTRSLMDHAVAGAGERVGQVYEAGGPIEVSTVSGRQIWGYSLISAGAVTTVAAGYYLAMSAQAYRKYQDADSASELSRYRDDTEESDQMWMILGPVGLGLVGGGTYLLLTDPARKLASREAGGARFTFVPVLAPGTIGVSCLGSF